MPRLDAILAEMERDTLNLDTLVLGPRMAFVWACKPWQGSHAFIFGHKQSKTDN